MMPLGLLERICNRVGFLGELDPSLSRRDYCKLLAFLPLLASNAHSSSLSEGEEVAMYYRGQLVEVWEHIVTDDVVPVVRG